jgi:hypothetical protein
MKAEGIKKKGFFSCALSTFDQPTKKTKTPGKLTFSGTSSPLLKYF